MDISKGIIRAKKNARLELNGRTALNKSSYWEDVREIPAADSEQLDLLTKDARRFIDVKKKDAVKDFSKKAPWDIYPVY